MKQFYSLIFAIVALVFSLNIVSAQTTEEVSPIDDSEIRSAPGCYYTGNPYDRCFDFYGGGMYSITNCRFGGYTTCGYYP